MTRANDRIHMGRVVCCDHPLTRFDSVGVRFYDTGEVTHVYAGELTRFASPLRDARNISPVSFNTDAAVGAMSSFVARLSEAVNAVQESFVALNTEINQQVGTTNNENEGEEMPNATSEVEVEEEVVTIAVPHSEDSMSELFQTLNTPQILMQGLDPESWEAHRQELLEAVRDVPWEVRRGSFTLDTYPTARVGRNIIRIRSTPLSVVQEFLASASNGRISLAPVENVAYKYRLKPISTLEDDAWVTYGGSSLTLYSDTSPSNGEELIDLRNVSILMSEFTSFMRHRDHREFIRQAMRDRMSGKAEKPNAKTAPEWTTTRADHFKTFLRGVKSRLRPEENPFQKLPILPHKTLSSRTWGIEIEAVDIEGVKTPEYWELKGDGSLRNLSVASIPSRTAPSPQPEVGTTNNLRPAPSEPARHDHDEDCGYFEDDEDEYGEETSGQCTCGYFDEYNEYAERYRAWTREYYNSNRSSNTDIRSHTGEWNSPVLRSYHSRGLKYICDNIESRNTNDSAGVHVHVGAGDLSPAQAIQLSIIYTALEPLFESEYHRGSTRTYCKSPDVPELINRFNAMRRVKAEGLGATAMQFSSRYWTVNLAALASHKTVEFRAMGSIYNYEHLVRWAYFCRELVNIARANVPQSVWTKVRTIEDLVSLFAKYGKETPTPEWAATELATDILESLGSENRRLPQYAFLNPESLNSPLLVNDDYSSSQTIFLGDRPVEQPVGQRSAEYSFSF